jgi:hypothetical protein
MEPFTIYDLETGKIKRIGSCQQEVLNLQAQEGEGIVLGLSNPLSDFVLNGVITRKDESELLAQELSIAERNLRSMRDSRLAASDWTQVPDAPVDQAAWAEYRQALRDLPANTTDPRNPVWPALPA